MSFKKIVHFLEHLFFKTVYERRLQFLKNVQIYCEDILKSMQMTNTFIKKYTNVKTYRNVKKYTDVKSFR